MKINENLAISESGFLFNPSTGESFTVNPIGAEILELMREGKTEAEISESIIRSYEVDSKTLQKDLHDFSEVLRHHQLLDQYEETKN
ncbi:MAG: PqqD family protein [Bacteroidales bacterium]|nr:PqqD family protein [Bacteroidales bacterium]MBK9357170.1 PqqD family protein [Bacteroidales bacterium]